MLLYKVRKFTALYQNVKKAKLFDYKHFAVKCHMISVF